MAFGGLRGAIAFSLANQLKDRMTNANLFITTTLFIVIWTVFVYGIGTKPLVNFLRIERQSFTKQDGVDLIIEKIKFLIIPLAEEIENKSQVHRWMRRLNGMHDAFIRWFVVGGQETVYSRRRHTVSHGEESETEDDEVIIKKKKPTFAIDDKFDPIILNDEELRNTIEQTRQIVYYDKPISLVLVSLTRSRDLPKGVTQHWISAINYADNATDKEIKPQKSPKPYTRHSKRLQPTVPGARSPAKPRVPDQRYLQALQKNLNDGDDARSIRSYRSGFHQ